MHLPAARVRLFLALSVLAVAAVAGGIALARRVDLVAELEHATWGAAAG
jgi:hypothetical protein